MVSSAVQEVWTGVCDRVVTVLVENVRVARQDHSVDHYNLQRSIVVQRFDDAVPDSIEVRLCANIVSALCQHCVSMEGEGRQAVVVELIRVGRVGRLVGTCTYHGTG